MQVQNIDVVRVQNYKVMDFLGEKGERVDYALATIIDETGSIVEVSASPKCDIKAPCDGRGVYDVFMGSNKEGKRVSKFKLVAFEIES